MILDKKWKYIAKDSDNNTWVYSDKPLFSVYKWVKTCVDYESYCIGDTHLTNFTAEDSLHEIVHNDDNSISFKKVYPPKPKFQIGDIIKHNFEHYKGKIVGINWVESTKEYEYKMEVTSIIYNLERSLKKV